MASKYTDLTKEVASIIESGSYTCSIDVRREYIARIEAKNLPQSAPYVVSVTPLGLSGRLGDRDCMMEADYSIGVEFLAQIRDTDNVGKIDEFFTAIEEIQNRVAANPILTESYLVFPYSNDTAFSQQSATEQIVFKNLTTFTYRISR